MPTDLKSPATHSDAWVFQTKASFAIALSAMVLAIVYVPVDPWIRAFLALGQLYVVTATIALAKTVRDEHESRRLLSRVDEVKLERFLAEHDPFRTAA